MYSNDIVNLVLYNYFILKYSVSQISKFIKICPSTIYRWNEKYNIKYNNDPTILKNWKPTKNLVSINIKRKMYSRKITLKIENYVEKYINKKNQININYLLKYIKNKFKINLKKSSIYKLLDKLGYSKKKIKRKLINKNELVGHTKKVENFIKKINNLNQDKVYSYDESHIHLNMTQNYGWSKKGEPCSYYPKNLTRKKYSLMLLLSNKKVIKYHIKEGSVKGEDFKNFLEELDLEEGIHIILDNAKCHKTKSVSNYVRNQNYKLVFNIPYSPNTNPIEMAFSKIKHFVRKGNNNTIENLTKNIIKSINKLTEDNLKNYYKKSFLL